MMLNYQLNILSLNVWGIPFVSRDRKERIAAIATELMSGKYDVVSLQEVWSQTDCELLKTQTETVLPYSHYFYSGVIGAGLLVLAKYPIISTLFHSWPVNGYFHRIQHADWFGGKGVGLCRIRINKDIILHLYNAHLHAEYDNINDEYKTHRVIQAYDTAQFIRATKANSTLQVLAGDLNTQPDDICYKTLLYLSGMVDCCTNGKLTTNCCPQNTYTSKRETALYPKGVRIDHIFMKPAETAGVSANIMDFSQPLPSQVPGHEFSYSDHEAILLQVQLNGHAQIGDHIELSKEKESESSTQQKLTVLHEAIELCGNSLQKLKISRIYYYTLVLIMCLMMVALSEFSKDYEALFILLRLCALLVLIFALFMASIWNYMERNGILAEQKSMNILLHALQNGFS